MIIYDQLRISDDGKTIYIDAHVNKATEFEGTTIEELYICTGSQIYETLTIDPESNGHIYKKVYPEGTKEINEAIGITDDVLVYNKTDFSKDLFFVYIKGAGLPEDACCYTAVGNYVLAVTFDENLLYQRVMGYTKQLTDTCSVQTGFTDFILLWNAFKAAVETEHYVPAIKFYNLLFGKNANGSPYGPYGSANRVILKGCGCNG